MKKLLRILSILLVMSILAVSLLTGCTKKNEQKGQSNVTKSPDASAQPTENLPQVPKEHVQLEWYFFQPDPGPGIRDVEQAVGEYLKDKINVSIKIHTLGWDEFFTRKDTMIAANEPFDLIFQPSWLGFNSTVQKNGLLDITELVPKYMPKTWELINSKDSYKKLLVGATVEGKLYAVPTIKEVGAQLAITFNKNLLDKYNLKIDNIKDSQDLTPLLQVIKDNEPDVFPTIGIPFEHLYSYYPVLADDVITLRAKRGTTKVEVLYDLPEYKEYALLMREWNIKGFIPSDRPIMQQNALNEFRNNGKVFLAEANNIPGDEEKRSNDKVRWVNLALQPPTLRNKDLGGSQNAVSATSKNPDRALMFLEYVNTDAYVNNLLAFGIEGKHYKKINTNTIEPIKDSGYSHGWQWAYGNQFLNYLKVGEDDKKWELYEQFNSKCIPDPNLGFYFNTEKWEHVINAQKTLINEYYLGYGIVKKSVDEDLAELKKRLKDIGFYDFRDAVQQAYDEWLKNNK